MDDVVAAYYCAMDPQTPTKVRGVLMAALAYFVAAGRFNSGCAGRLWIDGRHHCADRRFFRGQRAHKRQSSGSGKNIPCRMSLQKFNAGPWTFNIKFRKPQLETGQD